MSSGSDRYGDPETRRRILQATREVLTELGPDLRVSHVAAAAGVSRQAVYLHFGDRTSLLMALLQHMDETLDLGPALQHIYEARSGGEVLHRTMQLHSTFSAAIEPVASVMESAQHHDEALRAAWRDRMAYRRQAHRRIVERLHELGDLADGLPVGVASDLFYAVTLPTVWREVTQELGWSSDEYVDRFTAFLRNALLREPEA